MADRSASEAWARRALVPVVLLGMLSVHAPARSGGDGVEPPTLEFLNGGPSSRTRPQGPDDPVLTLRYPREVVNVGVPYALPANLGGQSLTVERAGSTTEGVRWRSRAVLGTVVFNNQAELQIVGNPAFDADASESYIAFIGRAQAASIDTLAELEAVVGAGSANGPTPGLNYAKYLLSNPAFGASGGGLTDAQVTADAIRQGVSIRLGQLSSATPNGWGAAAAWQNFEIAIVVLESVAAGNQSDDLKTEWIYVRNPPLDVTPDIVGVRQASDGRITHILMQTNLQLTDDAPENPGDTSVLASTDFRVRVNGVGPVVHLASFLATIVGPPTVSGVTVTGDRAEVFRRQIEIALSPSIIAADAAIVMHSTLGLGGPARVFGVSGEDPSSNVGDYRWMSPLSLCPGDATGDERCDFFDLNAVLSDFGSPSGVGEPTDLDGNGVINLADLNLVLSNFGSACE